MSVIRGAGYILAHVPEMVIFAGTTQQTERAVNPGSEYLQMITSALREYGDALSYPPNQVYIGAAEPEILRGTELPWYEKPISGAKRYGKFGEIMPQEELYLLMRACDVFELVLLADSFIAEVLPRFKKSPVIGGELVSRVGNGEEMEAISSHISESGAIPLYRSGAVIGCVKRAHDIDESLSAHVMFENIASKATSLLALLHALQVCAVPKDEIEYVIDCSEEACGDMNQRGGGGLSKSIAEAAGLSNATGSDLRAFCAAPAHAIVQAAALVDSGVFKAVAVTAGGSTAKLGMNGKEHIKKGLPILEDVLGGFSVIITKNDGISPQIDLGVVGRHSVATGSSPQSVISSLVMAPLERAGMKILDVDMFASEMHNPDVTKPAGAGDVPLANYKMIGALAVMQGQMEKSGLTQFIAERGLPGWAPTQGHIPSGVPFIGFACERIMDGKLKNAMFIGKGSLFLGRMTNLFDGVSFLIKASTAKTGGEVKRTRIAVTGLGNELGESVVVEACAKAIANDFSIIYLGTETISGAENIYCAKEDDCAAIMQRLLNAGECDAAVAMHYGFPIGTATVGRVITPAQKKEMFIATTTGTPSSDRTQALVLGALYGIITAKSCGIDRPTVGILGIDGARRTEAILRKLNDSGFKIDFAQSGRKDGGAIMRGNDILLGTADILVCDTLTGNVIVKMLSAYESGGKNESSGFGYGPGIGKNTKNPVLIVSRASDSKVIEGAISYAAEVLEGGISSVTSEVFALAEKCGLGRLFSEDGLGSTRLDGKDDANNSKQPPDSEPVTEEISGIEVMDIEDAARALWNEGIYAEAAMGCTGPVIMISKKNLEKAIDILGRAGFIFIDN